MSFESNAKTGKIQLSTGRKVLFALILFALLLVVSEAALRLREKIKFGIWTTGRMQAQGRPPEIYGPHPYLPVVLVPGSHVKDEKQGQISINSLGFRGGEIALEKPRGVFRVACIGGSTTFGTGASADDKTWPARLEKMLAEKFPDKTVEVINAGIPGFTTADNFIYYQLRVSALKPDLVLIYHGYNDIKANRYGEQDGVKFQRDYSHIRSKPRFVVNNSPVYQLGKHFLLYLKFRDAVQDWARDREEERLIKSGAGKFDEPSAEGVAAFQSHLGAIVALARKDGASVMLGTLVSTVDLGKPPEEIQEAGKAALPFFPQFSIKGVYTCLERNNGATRDLAARENIPFVDFAANFPKDSKYFRNDDIHFNDAGNDLAAQKWLEAILALGILEE